MGPFLPLDLCIHTMTSISKSILSFIDRQKLQLLLSSAIDTCMKHEAVSDAIILLMDEEQEFKLEISSSSERIQVMENDPSNLELHFPQSLLKHVIEQGAQLKLASLSSEKKFQADPYVVQKNPQAVLCLPIKANEEVFGVLYVEAEPKVHSFSELDLVLFAGLCTQLALSLESSARHEELNRKLSFTQQELKAQKAESILLQDSLEATQSKMIHLEKMASIGQMTAGIAHEINNPVNFVKSNIDSIKLDLEDLKSILHAYQQIQPETAEENLEKANALAKKLDLTFLLIEIDKLIVDIKEGASRTSEIISGLRNFSRLDEFDFKFVDINKGLDSTLTLLNNRFKERIRIHKEYADLELIECLPGKIYQVFMNILTNSIQAIQGKGDIFISTKQNGNTVFISIRDTGIGMSEEVRKNIFEPFFTTKDVGEGTGLGLSISHEIIEKHHGEIRVNSTPSIGTEFIITLPVKQRHQDHG